MENVEMTRKQIVIVCILAAALSILAALIMTK